MSKDIQQQRQFKILVIGDSCTDLYQFGICDRISGESPVPIFKISNEELKPGMAGNVAKNLEGLGHEVTLVTNKEYIEKRRVIDERFFHHMIRIDSEPEVSPFKMSMIPEEKIMYLYDGFVISDYCKGFLDFETCSLLVEKLLKFKKPIFVDTKKINLDCFKGCFIKINELEFSLIKSKPDDCTFIITLGKRGAKLNDKIFKSEKSELDNLVEKSNYASLKSINACGAGDTFLCGLVDKYLQTSGDMAESVVFANKCAAIAINNFGTYSIKRSDLL